MSEALERHIKKFVNINDEEIASIKKFFRQHRSVKKEVLIPEGQICRSNFFVEKGCLRLFFVDGKGVEKTVQFAIESWWLSDYRSFQTQTPSEFYIQAVEKSDILILDNRSQEEMLKQHPRMERYFHQVHQKAHAALQFRIRYFYDFSKEELYKHFNSNFPQFVQRVPQYLLASYLGITPEYLSELRAKEIS
jgi:CRP-like cAMP-binding protein